MVLQYAISSAIGGLWGTTAESIDFLNGTFGSVVAVTGDAHQAQVAQDIFRQEVRIERSLRVREDIRDAHQLMIENVQSQLLMGTIVLGICFTVLIEGRPSDPLRAPVLVQELWALLCVWAISLSFLSVWYALQYQEQVSVSSRKRLLEKHRIMTPNDEVVGRMGGLSLAEKVSQLHQRGLNEIADFLESRTGCEGARQYICSRAAELMKSLPPGPISCGSVPDDVNDRVLRKKGSAFSASSMQSVDSEITTKSFGPDMRHQDSLQPELEVLVCPNHEWLQPDQIQNISDRQRLENSAKDPVTVRMARGTRAWYSKDDNCELMKPHFVDMPDFLEDETLVRCPWHLPGYSKSRSIRLMVRGTATLYVAAQWPPLDSSEAFRGRGPPPPWSDEEIPLLRGGREPVPFQKVEGFSLLVNESMMELPIYRAALPEPDSSGWCKVKLLFRFPSTFVAPVIILRKGRILTAEEDWPVREFMDELETIQPLRDHSMRYMSLGLLHLVLAAFFAHLGRVLTDRPWPKCERELIFIGIALLPAVFITLMNDRVMRRLFETDFSKHQRFKKFFEKYRGLPGIEKIRRTKKNASPISGHLGRSDLDLNNLEPTCPPVDFERLLTPNSVGNTVLDPSPKAEGLTCCMSPIPEETSSNRYKPSCSPGAVVKDEIEPGTETSSSGSGLLIRCGPGKQKKWNQDDMEVVVDDSEHTSRRRVRLKLERSLSDAEMGEVAWEGAADLEDPEQDCEEVTKGKSRWSQDSPMERRPKIEKGIRCWKLGKACCFRRRDGTVFESWRPNVSKFTIVHHAVCMLWFLSLAIVLGGHIPEWSIFKNGADDAAISHSQTCGSLGNRWTARRISWGSPFFSPTAASATWVASDWLFTVLPSVGSKPRTYGRLPTAAKGLFPIPHNDRKLLLAGEEQVHVINVDAANFPVTGNEDSTNPVSESERVESSGIAFKLPVHQLGQIGSAASAFLPLSGGTRDSSTIVFALAPQTGGVYLSHTANLSQALANVESGSLQPTPNLEIALQVPRRVGVVRSLHICGAECSSVPNGEPALWAADADGCLIAIGLDSGAILGSWRWAPLERASTVAVSLSGNSTHLFLLSPCLSLEGFAPQAAHSVAYETLFSDDNGSRASC